MAQPIGEMLQQLAELDVFFYVLPFLLIFALVFAVLQKVNIAGGDAKNNRGINAVIALTIGLLALQFDQVPIFFQIIFPKLGIGLAVLLMFIIMLGLFMDFKTHRGPAYIFIGIGGLISAWIFFSTIEDYSWWTGSFWADNISSLVALAIVIAFIVVVVNSGGEKSQSDHGFWAQIPGGK